MGTLHYYDGGKGGVGKSFCSMTAIQYHIDKKIPFIACEADRYNPDVANRYQDLEFIYAIFSEDERVLTSQRNPDRLIDLAVDKDIVISLPAQVAIPFERWLETAVDTCRDMDVKIIRWFVTSGRYESLELFSRAVKRYGASMPFVLIKNWGISSDWEELEQDKDIQKLIEEYRVKVIDFPRLPWGESNLLQKHNLTFGEAREDVKRLHSIQRTRVRQFLNKAYEAFESTGLMRNNAQGNAA